jgi:hypothetical protein
MQSMTIERKGGVAREGDRRRSPRRAGRWRRSLLATCAALLALVGVTLADDLITGGISQNTLSYQVTFGPSRAGEQFQVSVTNDRNGDSHQQAHTANEAGAFAGTQSPGELRPGDVVTLQVFELNGDGEWVANPNWQRKFEKPRQNAVGRLGELIGSILRRLIF